MLARHWCTALLLACIGAMPAGAADAFRQASAPQARPVDKRFLGMHLMYLVARPPGRGGQATPWPDAPVGSLRLYDSGVRWADLEPQRGRFQFERLDAYLQTAAQHGADVNLVLGSPPAWASARPNEKCPYGMGCAAEPADMADWENYVRTVARRFKGRIAVYELGNEPKFYATPDQYPGGFFSGSVEKMVEMGRIARRVLREEDPQARLASPGFDGGAKWLEMFLAAGGKSVIDIVAYHFYAPTVQGFAEQVATVRSVLARQGVAQLPLWNTESGFEADEPGARSLPFKRVSREEQAAWVSQSMVLAAAAGIERFYVYAWDHPSLGMLDAANAPQPAAAAIARTATWLLGATITGCRQDSTDAVVCDGTRDGALFSIAWAGSGRATDIAAPAGQRLAARESFGDGSRAATDTLRIGIQPTLLRWTPGATK